MKKIALMSYILLCSSNIFSQSIIGKLTDINNVPIENVNISINNEIGCSTDSKGDYILNLSQGKYIVVFKHINFSILENKIAKNGSKKQVPTQSCERYRDDARPCT